jgi:hypothetical protein
MKGVNFLTNNKGEKTAVVIDFKKYKEEVLDFIDGLEGASRAEEPSVNFERTIAKIIKTKSAKSRVGVHHKDKKVSRKRAGKTPT